MDSPIPASPAIPSCLKAVCPVKAVPCSMASTRRGRSAANGVKLALAITLTFLALGPPTAKAQSDTFSWIPVTPADLKLESQGKAHAIILEQEEFQDDPAGVISVHKQIKIFDEEGKKYGDIEIPNDAESTEIRNIHGRTVSPNGTSFEFQGPEFDEMAVKSKNLRRWYASLVKDRRQGSEPLRQQALELTAASKSWMEKVRAVGSYVQSQIRYVAIEVGIGGYQPHRADEILRDKTETAKTR